jgi:DNA-binding CsgD family transcriptional regulator
VSDGTCWGVGDLYRADAADAFDDRELQFLTRATEVIATATRAVTDSPAAETGALPDGAAVLIVEADGSVSGMTAAARDWVLTEQQRGADSRLWWAVRTAVATARRGVPTAYSRVRRGSAWIVVKASALRPGADTPVAVTIDEAGARDVADLFMAAHGITRREREVCHEVMAGRSTKEIAERLFIAPHTVQDHLKSIFAKTGVRSRRELVASFGA